MPTPKLNMSNQQFAERQKAAQQIQAGQQPTPTGPAALQQAGAQAGTAAQAAQTQGAIQQAGQQVADAQKADQMRQIQKKETRQMDELTAQKALQDQQRKLENYAQEIGNDMMEERRDFAEKGRQTAFNNERQLADWVTANSENMNAFNSRMQEIQQASARKIQTLEIINNRIKLEEDILSKQKMNSQTRAQKKRLAMMKVKMDEKIRREREKAKKKGGWMKALTGAVQVAAGVAVSFVPGAQAVGAGIAAQGLGQVAGGISET